MTAPIQDLRDAIALLQQHDNQYLETDHPVDPNAELAGVYRHIGAGGTVKRPTRIGPAMMFNNIKGYPHSRILVGMHASRQRAALLLGCEASQLALEVGKAVKKPVAPVVVPASSAPCQEQIFLADDPDFDLRTLLPAPTNTYRRRPLLLPGPGAGQRSRRRLADRRHHPPLVRPGPG